MENQRVLVSLILLLMSTTVTSCAFDPECASYGKKSEKIMSLALQEKNVRFSVKS